MRISNPKRLVVTAPKGLQLASVQTGPAGPSAELTGAQVRGANVAPDHVGRAVAGLSHDRALGGTSGDRSDLTINLVDLLVLVPMRAGLPTWQLATGS